MTTYDVLLAVALTLNGIAWGIALSFFASWTKRIADGRKIRMLARGKKKWVMIPMSEDMRREILGEYPELLHNHQEFFEG